MHVKKHGGRVYGADLTKEEQKAMNIEIKKQLAEHDRKHGLEMDALILWVLHEEFNFGPIRLRKFYDSFAVAIKELIARYDLEDTDDIWLCTRKLKDRGIDLEAWHKENNGGND